jgi:hypothetical protein
MTSRTVLLCFVTTQPSHSPLGSAVPQELSAGATCEDDELASLSVSRNPSQLSRNNSAYSVLRNPSQLSRNDSSPAMSRNSSRSNQRSDNDELQFSDIDEIQLESSPGVTRNSSKSQRHNSFNSFDSRYGSSLWPLPISAQYISGCLTRGCWEAFCGIGLGSPANASFGSIFGWLFLLIASWQISSGLSADRQLRQYGQNSTTASHQPRISLMILSLEVACSPYRTVLATAAANTSHMRTTPSREYVGLYGVGVKSGGGGGDPSPAVSRKSSAATASSVGDAESS